MSEKADLTPLIRVLDHLRRTGRVLIAVLYGSHAKGRPHKRSDIDLALFIKGRNEKEEIEIIDSILMSVDGDLAILRLDDEDESPFVVQEALKGTHMIDPDRDALYSVQDRVLHEAENIRFRKELRVGQKEKAA